jgi:hypothetical protein
MRKLFTELYTGHLRQVDIGDKASAIRKVRAKERSRTIESSDSKSRARDQSPKSPEHRRIIVDHDNDRGAHLVKSQLPVGLDDNFALQAEIGPWSDTLVQF